MTLRILVLFALMIPATLYGGETPLPAGEAEEFIRAVGETAAGADVRRGAFREERTSPQLAAPVVSSGVVYFSKDGRFRKETQTPLPATVVMDGETLWMHYPEWNEVEIYTREGAPRVFDPIDALVSSLAPQRWRDSFQTTVFRTDDGHRVALQPRRSLRRHLSQIDLLFDSNNQPTRVVVRSPDETVVQLELSGFRALDDSRDIFDFEIPPGATTSRPLESSP